MMDILGNNPGLVLATGAAITLGGLYFYCSGQEEKIHIPSDLDMQSEQMEVSLKASFYCINMPFESYVRVDLTN